jgi:hypothetical protein
MWEVPGFSIGAVTAAPALGLLTARSAISAILVRAGELVGPGAPSLEEGALPDSPSVRLDGAVRRKVGATLAAELDDMLEDAAKREVSARGAEVLLLTAEIVRWLRDGGELPGKGAIELLEVHVAIFNDARHEEEREMQRALLAVLLTLVGAQAEAIRGGRWRHRRVNVEAAEERKRRRFGANLDELREKRDLSIGELAAGAELEVLTVVGLIFAAESAGSGEIRLLAEALGVEPETLIPEEMPGGGAGGVGDEPEESGPGEREGERMSAGILGQSPPAGPVDGERGPR